MGTFPLRLPDDLKDAAAAQAEAQGVSLNQYIATVLASRVGAQAEVRRYFDIRAARTKPGHAREVLTRSGIGNAPRPDDAISN